MTWFVNEIIPICSHLTLENRRQLLFMKISWPCGSYNWRFTHWFCRQSEKFDVVNELSFYWRDHILDSGKFAYFTPESYLIKVINSRIVTHFLCRNFVIGSLDFFAQHRLHMSLISCIAKITFMLKILAVIIASFPLFSTYFWLFSLWLSEI